jgi:hypothetical protein
MTNNQVVSTMFDIKSFIRMARFILIWDRDKDPGLGAHSVMCFSQAAMDII